MRIHTQYSAAAILATLLGVFGTSFSTGATRYVPRKQSSESIDWHLDRAKKKRSRKSAILNRLADTGAIARA
jgi:hypothetical protein